MSSSVCEYVETVGTRIVRFITECLFQNMCFLALLLILGDQSKTDKNLLLSYNNRVAVSLLVVSMLATGPKVHGFNL